MLIEKDAAIAVSDGLVLRANVYRPEGHGRFPVILAHGCYGKDVHFADGYAVQWKRLLELHPGLCGPGTGSSGDYLRWETVDPERWVPDGFACVQVDSRGSGKSPGYLDPFSPREIEDYADAIGWAADQPWSNGRVGLLGISYLAITQWLVAARRPRGLAAIAPWEGGSDHYRDWSRHGGIFSNVFLEGWWPRQLEPNQHGQSKTRYRDRQTGVPNTGTALTAEILAGNRATNLADIARHPLDDAWHRERSPLLERIEVPLLSAGNWSGPGLHLRGNVEGWMRAGSARKWLSMHAGTHFESFYMPDYIALQKRFFGYFLRGDDNGWLTEAPVRMTVRHPGGDIRRAENEFPLARTIYQDWFLVAEGLSLQTTAPAEGTATFHSSDRGLTFATAPFAADVEFTGFVSLRLWIAASEADADFFVTLRALRPDGSEWILEGAHEPTPIARGWLRASHRKLDRARSLPFRPYHAHDEKQPLVPGETVPLDIEIWPTSVVIPAGWRLALTVAGRDFEYPGVAGRLLHTYQPERPKETSITIRMGGPQGSRLRLPLIPATEP